MIRGGAMEIDVNKILEMMKAKGEMIEEVYIRKSSEKIIKDGKPELLDILEVVIDGNKVYEQEGVFKKAEMRKLIDVVAKYCKECWEGKGYRVSEVRAGGILEDMGAEITKMLEYRFTHYYKIFYIEKHGYSFCFPRYYLKRETEVDKNA